MRKTIGAQISSECAEKERSSGDFGHSLLSSSRQTMLLGSQVSCGTNLVRTQDGNALVALGLWFLQTELFRLRCRRQSAG